VGDVGDERTLYSRISVFPGGGGREQVSQIKRLLTGLNAKNLYISVVQEIRGKEIKRGTGDRIDLSKNKKR
jgi:hypothetical protein